MAEKKIRVQLVLAAPAGIEVGEPMVCVADALRRGYQHGIEIKRAVIRRKRGRPKGWKKPVAAEPAAVEVVPEENAA
jgi:hypothetical protein